MHRPAPGCLIEEVHQLGLHVKINVNFLRIVVKHGFLHVYGYLDISGNLGYFHDFEKSYDKIEQVYAKLPWHFVRTTNQIRPSIVK